jgi:hypothetical protein
MTNPVSISQIQMLILKFFIDHTDLNQTNYANYAPSHIIFSTGLWKKIPNLLVDKSIDLLKIDDLGNNCYSYINDQDKKFFMELTKKIKLPLEVKDSIDIKNILGKEQIKNLLINDLDDKDKSRNYGLFNSNLQHYMLYLKYLENKYKNMFVPVQIYNEDKKTRDSFFFGLTAYEISRKQELLIKHIKGFMSMFYSYLPHSISWIDQDQYYIDPELVNILKKHDSTITTSEQRYILIKITLVVHENLLHSNILIYDRQKKEAWRFEPYGITEISGKALDEKIQELLETVYGKIIYYDPNSFLSGINFQLVDEEEFFYNQNLGDPGGYCLAWSLWFVEAVIANPDQNVNIIMKNFFDRQNISSIVSEEEGLDESIISTNYYLDFIRRYAHKLDREKNKILQSMGIKKYYMYNTSFKPDVINKITDMFKVYLPKNIEKNKNQFTDLNLLNFPTDNLSDKIPQQHINNLPDDKFYEILDKIK